MSQGIPEKPRVNSGSIINGTPPLYTLLRDPKPIATNGSAKKHAFSLRKKILVGGLIAVALGVSIWQLNEYQTAQRREQFITWVAKYRPGWSSSMIKAEWDKIQYAREHTDIVESPELTEAEYQRRMAAHELTLGDVNRHNRGE